MMQPYQLTNGTSILRVIDNTFIPPDPFNADYQIYLAWVSAGNIADPYVAPSPTIQQQIDALEALQSDRMLRETATGATNTFKADDPNFPSMTSAQALASIQTKIVALRAQITSS